MLVKRLACGSPFQKRSDFEIPVKSIPFSVKFKRERLECLLTTYDCGLGTVRIKEIIDVLRVFNQSESSKII